MSPARRKDLAALILGMLVVVVDQVTKRLIVAYFSAAPRQPIALVGNVLQLQYLRNSGIAFSLLEGQTIEFALIAAAMVVVGYLYWRTHADGSLLLKLSFGLILGGAVGNLIDRFTRQYVVDFIHFQIPHVFDWPIFNVADSAISVGVVLLALILWHQGATVPAPAHAAPPAAGSEPPAASEPPLPSAVAAEQPEASGDH